MKNKYLDWLKKNQRNLNISGINTEAGLPANVLHKWLKGVRPLPDKYIPDIEKFIQRFIKKLIED